MQPVPMQPQRTQECMGTCSTGFLCGCVGGWDVWEVGMCVCGGGGGVGVGGSGKLWLEIEA